MKRALLVLSVVGLTTLLSCHRNPITGRKQLTLVSEKEVRSMALTQYQQFLTTNKVAPVNDTAGEMVKRVGSRIAAAIGRYYKEQGLLPITQNETALTIVLGHEITHAVAGHGRERMSHQLLAQGIQVAGTVAR